MLNRTALGVILGLVLVMVIGAVVAEAVKKASEPEPPGPLDNARAVLLPSGDGVERTVAVPPCQTSPETTANDLAAGRPAPSTVVLELSGQGEGQAVLVPDCIRGSTAVIASGELPAAAFVLPVGVQEAAYPRLQLGTQSQLIVPAGSSARTIIVPPCTGERPRPSGTPTTPAAGGATGSDVILEPAGGREIAIAPSC